MMKPLTAAEIRERIAKEAPEKRQALIELAWSCHDLGLSAGLAGQARVLNPFESLLPPAMPDAPKGKAR